MDDKRQKKKNRKKEKEKKNVVPTHVEPTGKLIQ